MSSRSHSFLYASLAKGLMSNFDSDLHILMMLIEKDINTDYINEPQAFTIYEDIKKSP